MNRNCELCGYQDCCPVYAHIVLIRYDYVECPLENNYRDYERKTNNE